MANTIVNLYTCHTCGRLRDSLELGRGERCKCGGCRVIPAHPTLANRLKFWLNNPKMIKTWITENVL